MLRGTPGEALEAMHPEAERPLELVGWARGEGVRARAYNDLGDHVRARQVALRPLEHLTHEDLSFNALNLGLQIELARAEAGLGELEAAKRRLHELLEDYEQPGNPLTVGALHEALADVAGREGDRATREAHVHEVDRWFRSTRHPALVARCERLVQSLKAGAAASGGSEQPMPRLMTVLHNLRHGGEHTLSGSAAWALKQLVDLTDVDEGYLFLGDKESPPCVARIGELDKTADLRDWVRDQLLASGTQTVNDMDCTAVLEEGVPVGDADAAYTLLDRRYRLFVLIPPSNTQAPIGALVLPLEANLPVSVLQEIAARLSTGLATAST